LSVLAINIASARAAWFSFDALEKKSASQWCVAYGGNECSFLWKWISRKVGNRLVMTNHRHRSRLRIHKVVNYSSLSSLATEN
jgi:hypothetical protein